MVPHILVVGGTGMLWDFVEALARDGVKVRVVSMPCIELFEAQPQDYRDDQADCETAPGPGKIRALGGAGQLLTRAGHSPTGSRSRRGRRRAWR